MKFNAMFKKLKLLLFYIKTIKKNKEHLSNELNISIDWVWRMYTTYTIPPIEIESVKQLGSSYLEGLLKKEIIILEKGFNEIGLFELYKSKEIVELNERQVGITYQFKLINTVKLMNNIIWFIIFNASLIIGFISVPTYIGIIYGLCSFISLYTIKKMFVALFV